MVSHSILLLPGDGIGTEIASEVVRILDLLRNKKAFACEVELALVGGASIDAYGVPLSDEVLQKASDADAVILGAVGGPQWDSLTTDKRPEKGLLQLRRSLDLYANLRPAILYQALAKSASLHQHLIADLDILIVRELTGGVYFAKPRGVVGQSPKRRGLNTMAYDEVEIERIARSGFLAATQRHNRLCSVDKANVLEVSQLWRDVVQQVALDFPQVELSHMYVDNAAMQLVRNPKQFDVIVTENMFGDILSDLAAMLTGSIGMLPSASLNAKNKGMYEPVHGSAPDIAGKNIANPLASILCVAMMLRYSFGLPQLADSVEQAVRQVLDDGIRTADIATEGEHAVTTAQMGEAVAQSLADLL